MSTRRMLIAAFVVVLAVLVVWSFYSNVMAPHGGDGTSPTQQVETQVTGTQETGAQGGGVVPDSLGGLAVTEKKSGEPALGEVGELHGGSLGSDVEEAWVARYGEGEVITLWVSRSSDRAAAESLLTRMTDRILEGQSPFRMTGNVEEADISAFALDGMGQRHYYFTAGSYLYWLAAPTDTARAVLSSLAGAAQDTAGVN